MCALTKAEYEKIITLKASKDLKKLSMEERLGTLKIHEIKLNKDEGQRKGSRWKNHSKNFTKEVKDKSQVICYKCKKTEHFKFECPSLKKEKEKEKKNSFKKKKSLMTTWENLDLSFYEEEDKESNISLVVDIHKKLGHASLRLISKLKKHNLIRRLPSLAYKVDLLCDACYKGKQVKRSFEFKNIISTSRPLELLKIDLFSPIRIASMSGRCYGLVVVDGYFGWT
ncbi:hypothetical protein CR513_31431, partial [Mucuna pruriens]